EEDLEQLVVAELRGIEADLDHLGVSGPTGAHLLVAGARERAARVSGFHFDHTLERLEHRLETPEAASREGGDLGHGCVHEDLAFVRGIAGSAIVKLTRG